MTRLESPDNLDHWIESAARSAARLVKFRALNMDFFVRTERRILYRRQRIVAKLMVRNVARSN